jgi:hypothetical protein
MLVLNRLSASSPIDNHQFDNHQSTITNPQSPIDNHPIDNPIRNPQSTIRNHPVRKLGQAITAAAAIQDEGFRRAMRDRGL